MTNFKIFLFIYLHFIVTFAKISDKRLCYDSECSEPVSLAKTLLRYSSDDSRILSFQSNVEVKIFSKSAGSRTDLWGAEIKGKRGYIPNNLIREYKILHNNLNHLVATEGVDDPKNPSTPKIVAETIPVEKIEEKVIEEVEDKISPNTVSPIHEVIDGTTIYDIPNDSNEYFSTPSSVDTPTEPIPLSTIFDDISSENLKPVSDIEHDKTPENLNYNQEFEPNLEQNSDYTENKTIIDNNQSSENLNNAIKDSEETKINVENSEEIKSDLDQTENKAIQKSEDVETNVENKETIDVVQTETNEVVDKETIETENNTIIDNNQSSENNLNTVINEIQNSEDSKTNVENEETIDIVKKETNEVNKETIETENKNDENAAEIEIEDEEEEIKDKNEEDEENDKKEEEEKPVKQENIDNTNDNNGQVLNTIDNQVTLENLNNNPSEIINESSIPVISSTEQIDSLNQNDNAADQTLDNIKHESENITDEIKLDEPILDEKEKIESVSNTDGVPSFFPNPLNLFSSSKVQVEQTVESITQVPEISTISNENIPPQNIDKIEINNDFIPTTETTHYDNPIDVLSETFTDNPNILNSEINKLLNDKTPEFIEIQHDSSIKQSDLLKSSNEFSFKNDFDKKYDSIHPDYVNQLNTVQNNIGIGSVEEIITNTVKEQLIDQQNSENTIQQENISEEPGFFSNLFTNLFGSSDTSKEIDENIDTNEINKIVEELPKQPEDKWTSHFNEKPEDKYLSPEQTEMESCTAGKDTSCPFQQNYIKSENGDISWAYEIPDNAYIIFLYLCLTAVTVLLFSLGYYYIEKRRKDSKLIANINELEKKLLIITKEYQVAENELKITKEQLNSVEDNTSVSNDVVSTLNEELEEMKLLKCELEDQVAYLESQLEKATETGLEMNKMLTDLFTSQNDSDHLMQTINQLHKQLNSTQSNLSEKNKENELLQTELQLTNDKIAQLQSELDKMVVNLLTIQEERSKRETELESEIEKMNEQKNTTLIQVNEQLLHLQEENRKLNTLIEESKRMLDLKNAEYDNLKQCMGEIEVVQSNKESLKALLDVSQVKAEVQQLRDEKHKLSDKIQKEINEKLIFEKEVQVMLQEVKILKDKFEEAEKDKVEAETRLEVLSSYFKEREAQYQKEINENESKWMQKEGEASSTVERIKWIQEELQNYKSQNELLKKEILDQEVSLKSQISMLEKKSHDNWVLARQAERRLEESKQEASQLRNRLTIVEKNLSNSTQITDESKIQNRIMSPLESNGDVGVSPLHMSNVENPGSPPLLFPHRDHMTTSPPLGGLPFIPPPPGVPFMPPPLPGVPPFMPPPPALFPGDHRPPPLGRMSSPPLHGRYSPDSRAYSPYDRDESPPLSPTYTDNDYRRRSPPRNFSPYSSGKQRHWDDDREYRGQHNRNKSRPHKGLSSGSGNSNESLDNSGRHSGRV